MSLLVDYRCDRCLGRTEEWVPSPVPATKPCPACGGTAKRAWSPVGFLRGTAVSAGSAVPSARPSASTAPSGGDAPAGRAEAAPSAEPLCMRNPDVPGLCHMSPSAGRAWLARARKDNRALDRELERQERAAAARPPTLADAVAHDHGHGHGPAPAPA